MKIPMGGTAIMGQGIAPRRRLPSAMSDLTHGTFEICISHSRLRAVQVYLIDSCNTKPIL